MKIIRSVLVITIIAAGIISLPSCQSSKTTTAAKMLKFNLEKGKGYSYGMIWDMDMKVQGQTSKMTMDGQYTMTIVDEQDHVKTVATTYKSIKLAMNMMGIEIELDSDKPSVNGADMKSDPLGAMNKIMASLINKPFMVKVDEEGNVLEVTGFDQLVHDMIDSLGLDDNMKATVTASMKDQFNENSIKDNFAEMFTIFPNKEVKVGDTWKKTRTTSGKMGATYITTYTVKDIDGNHVTLKTESKIGSDRGDSEINGTQSGNIVVDSKTGLIMNAEYDQDMKINSAGTTVDLTGKGKIRGTAL